MGRWLDRVRAGTGAESPPPSATDPRFPATSANKNVISRKPPSAPDAEAAYRAAQRARWDLLVDLTAAERAGDRRQAQAIRRTLDEHFRGPYTAAADAYWTPRGFPRDPSIPLRHCAATEGVF